MSEISRTHSPRRVTSYNGLLVLTALAMTVGISVLPIDIWSRGALLVWSLMVMHMSVSMMKMLRANSESRVSVRNSGSDRVVKPLRTGGSSDKFL